MSVTARHRSLEELLAHATWLRGLARSLVGQDAAAEDLVQETYLAAIKSPPDRDRPPRPWLATVLRNLVRMRGRGDGRRAQREEAAPAAPGAPPRPDEVVSQLLVQRTLCEIVEALPEPYRQTVILRYFDGLEPTEIARRTGIAAGTVRWRHQKALALLRKSLDERAQGGRRAWVASMVPLCSLPAPSAGGSLLKGFALMKVSTKVGLGVVTIAGAALWWTLAGEAPPAQTETHAGSAPASARLYLGDPGGSNAVEGRASLRGRVIGAADGTTPEVTLFRIVGVHEPPAEMDVSRGSTFEFDGLGPGRYCLSAAAKERRGSACDVRLGHDEHRERDVHLTRPGALLYGLVRDGGGGTVPEPVVTAETTTGELAIATVRGDAAGRYELPLAIGAYRVTVRADGYASASRSIEIAGDTELDVSLNPAAIVYGSVTLGEDLAPAPGAVVTAAGDRSHVATADASGRFQLANLPPGPYDLTAALGPAAAAADLTLTLGESREVNLQLEEQGGAVVGRVVEADTGDPVAAAPVRVSGRAAREGLTDAAGRFDVSGLLPGEYQVSVAHGRFVRATKRALVSNEAAPELTIELEEGGRIRGRVTGADGTPVAGALVRSSAWALEDARLSGARSDEHGRFELAPVPPGRVDLSAFHPDHGITEIADAEVAAGQRVEIDLMFSQSASIAGMVRYDDGSPAPGATVAISTSAAHATWTTTSGEDGRYRVDSLPGANYWVRARPPSSLPGQAVRHGPSEALVELGDRASKTIDLEVPGGSETIRGRVLAPDGAPVAGAAVWAERRADNLMSMTRPGQVRAYTFDDGTFELDRLPRGTYSIYVRHVDYGMGQRSRVDAGASDVVVELAAPATITGRVTRIDGSPPASFQLTRTWLVRQRGGSRVRQSERRTVMDPDGRFTLRNLPATREIKLGAETSEGEYGSTEKFALAPGDVKEIHIRLAPMGTVRGRLIDAQTGQPAVGVVINLAFRPASVDGQGRFELDVPAGHYDGFSVQTETVGLPVVPREFEVRGAETTDLGDIPVGRAR